MWPPVRAVGFLLKHREQLCPMSVARKHSIFDNARRSHPKRHGLASTTMTTMVEESEISEAGFGSKFAKTAKLFIE
jgi:hypothetical protein